jgi:hypothetical protein
MRGKKSCSKCKCCNAATETIRHMVFDCKWAKEVRKAVFTEWWARTGDATPVVLPSFRRSILCTETERESAMDSMRRTLNHITSYFIWRKRCGIWYSGEETTPPITTANGIWKEFETTLKARRKVVATKEKWWKDRVRAGEAPTAQADEALTVMRAEAAEAKVVLEDWITPDGISPETKAAIGKWCFETAGNDADIVALVRPRTFPRWNYKWRLGAYPASGGDGTSEPDGGTTAPPIRQFLTGEGLV